MKTFRICARAAASIPALALALCATAQAQEASNASPEASSGENVGLDEIVVTAQRREENLQRAAIAVSAVSGDALISAGVSDVNNLSKLVPSLVVQQSLGSATNFYLRGVGSFAANAFGENPIAFSFNGVYIGRASAPIGTFYDLERVEVLKGPQGTLYGRNATGGAINVIPRKPSLSGIDGDVTLEFGNYESKKITGGINLPLSDTVAVRVAGQGLDRSPYLSDGYDDEGGAAGRVSLLFEPSGTFSTLIVADYFKQDANGPGSVLAPSDLVPLAPPISDRIGAADPRSISVLRTRFAGLINSGLVGTAQTDGFVKGEFWGVSATIEADLGFAGLTVIPAYRYSKPYYLSYNQGFFGLNDERDNQMSLEIRLASNGDQRLRYVIGGFYFYEQQVATNHFNQGRLSNTTFVANIDNDSIAGFGQLTYDVTDRLRAVGGIRYTRENKRQDTLLRQLTPASPPNAPFVPIKGELSFESTNYRAGFEFDAGPQSLLFANVATGFKSGGFFISVADNTFDPEEIIAYTIGAKNRFFDNRLQFNVDGFYWDYKDQQIFFIGPIQSSPGVFGSGGVTVNAGNARIYGADAEVRYQLSPNILIGADVQYLNTEYTTFNYRTVSATGAPPRNGCRVTPDASLPIVLPARLFLIDCEGKPAVNAPEWSVNLSYQHMFPLGGGYDLVAAARTRIEASRFLTLEFLDDQRQDSYRTSDITLTLEGPGDRWALTGFVNNVEDRTLLAGSGLRPILSVAYNVLRPPRTYGVRGTVRF